MPTTPAYVAALEAVYGPPSSEGFGSAAFFVPGVHPGSLPEVALERYRFFVGELWGRYGEEAWMGPWRQVYERPPGAARDVASELAALDDPEAGSSAGMILDNAEDPDQARAALSGAFDDPAVSELAVFNLGDGQAMSGVLVAGRRGATGDAVFLVLLLD